MIDTLFICKANVQRSQIAEWLYNHYSKTSKSISCAWVEARKNKYAWKSEKKISNILLKDWIDIREQTINYMSDFSRNKLNKIKRVIFLFQPENEKIIDTECLINWISVYDYFLQKTNIEIIIHKIKDPYNATTQEMVNIYKNIDFLLKNEILKKI